MLAEILVRFLDDRRAQLAPRNLSIAASSKARSDVNSWAPSVRPLVYVMAAMSFGREMPLDELPRGH